MKGMKEIIAIINSQRVPICKGDILTRMNPSAVPVLIK